MASSKRTKRAKARTKAGAAARAKTRAAARTARSRKNQRKVGQAHAGLASRSLAAVETVANVSISCLANTHYHAAREAWLDTVHRWLMFFVIALGAAALADAIPKLVGVIGLSVDATLVKEMCAAGAAILAALDLTFDLSNRARAHAMMKRRYYELLASLREGHKTPTQGRVCLDQFSADEEPPYKVLFLACWNEAERNIRGVEARKFNIPDWDNFWKNCFRRPSVTYPVIPATSSVA